MQYLRVGAWYPGRATPLTSVIAADSLREPIYVAANNHRAALAAPSAVQGIDYEVEIHDLPDSVSEVEAILRISMSRKAKLPQVERDRHTLHDWCRAMLHRVKPRGLVQNTERGPLSVGDIKEVLEVVAMAPDYEGQTFGILARDGTLVQLALGEVTVLPGPGGRP